MPVFQNFKQLFNDRSIQTPEKKLPLETPNRLNQKAAKTKKEETENGQGRHEEK